MCISLGMANEERGIREQADAIKIYTILWRGCPYLRRTRKVRNNMGEIRDKATKLYEEIQKQLDKGSGVYLCNKEEMLLIQTYIVMVNNLIHKEG